MITRIKQWYAEKKDERRVKKIIDVMLWARHELTDVEKTMLFSAFTIEELNNEVALRKMVTWFEEAREDTDEQEKE